MLALCTLASSCSDPEPRQQAQRSAQARLLLINLHGYVGCGADADLIRQGIAEQLARVNDPPDAVVFSLDSQGGMLNRVGPLSDLIHERIQGRARCIGWVQRAESAAALVALNIPDLWMPVEGTIGGAVGVRRNPAGDGWVPLSDQEQQAVRYVAAACAARGGHDQALALSLTVPENEGGEPIGSALVLTGDSAERAGLVRIADALESALDSEFGPGGWVVDQEVSRSISGDIASAEALREEVIELQNRFRIAIEMAEGGNPDALSTADRYFDAILAVSVREDPPALRVIAFLGLFDWIDGALDRMGELPGEIGP